ncbi:Copia protein [Folsomia candida]|uniref:Copia protein n=1 Tax=Folsomia candida TaxID=158441 RepID=A0A226D912_FOLCA|nr:Copia protein [Folsomia candida]
MSKIIKIDHSNVKKLEGSRDYPLWKINLENIFWASGLDQVGMGIILQTVNEKLTSYICSSDTAEKMWTTLEQTFGKSSKWTNQQLLQKFYQSTLGERTATELVSSLQTIGGQLKAMGYTSLDEEAILSKALHELRGPRYDSFVSSWDVVPDCEKTIVNLVQKLNIHQSREESWCKDTVSEKAFSSVKAGEAHATYLHKTRSGPENGNEKEERKKKKRCYNCGLRGHIKVDCRFPLKKKEGETTKDKKKDEKIENNKEHSDKKKNFVSTTDKSFMIKSSRHATRDAYVWYCDSGTNVHVFGRREWFVSYEEFETPRKLQVATNTYADCPGEGTVAVQACIKGNWEVVTLTKVLFLPKGANLFSQNRMLKRGFYAQSSGEGTTFYEQNGKESLKAKLSEDGMQIMLFKPVEKDPKAFMCASQKRALQRWYERLAHVGFKYLKNSVNKQAVFLGRQNELEEEYRCEVCIKAKATLKPYPTQSERNYETGELLHFDLGHAVSRSNQGNKYFLLVKDNESSYRVVYFQNNKLAETTVRNIKDAVEMFSNQIGLRVKRLKSDKGCEFKNQLMEQFISEKGIIYEYTPAGCSQANGKIEREVRTVRNTARALLLEAALPPAFWQDAVGMAVYTLNRLLSSTNKEATPHEILFGRKPNLSHTRIFGCPASARLLTPKGEWTTKTREGIFVGHVPDTREYKLYDRKNGEYFLSRHVDFFEDYIPYRPSSFVREVKFYESEEDEEEDEVKTESKPGSSQLTEIDLGESKDEDVLEIHADTTELLDETTVLSWSDQMEENSAEEDFHDATVGEDETENWIPEGSRVYEETMPEEASNDETTTTTTGSRKSKRTNKGVLPKRYANSALEIQQKLNELTLQDRPHVEPKSYEEALSCWDRMEWKEAMEEEINSQLANDTWELVQRPVNKKVLKNMWLYKLKTLPEGGIRYKSRLVVKGCGQPQGIDFKQCFAPVIRYETVRLLIAVGAARSYSFMQFDISTAFLNAKLDEEVYMEQPVGFKIGENLVCRLKKGMYGLRSSPRLWHKEMKKKLLEIGFRSSLHDPCLFIYERDGNTVLIGLYVDDGLMCGNNGGFMESIILNLRKSFKMTTKTNVKMFLGLEIVFTKEAIQIHQEKYINEVATRFGLSQCKRMDIPMTPSHNLEPDTVVNRHDPTLKYQELVGALLFISRCMRPDIAFALNKLSRYFQCFEEKHWNAAKQVVRYLVTTSTHAISYPRGVQLTMNGFSDADYASDKQQLRSTTGVIFMLNDSPLSWISRRQSLVAQSASESEYVALAVACKEGIWLRNILCKLKVLEWNYPFTIFTDSQSAMALANKPELSERTKHISVRWHFIRWLLETNQLKVKHQRTNELVADALTKALPRSPFFEKRSRMNLRMKPEEPVNRKSMMSVVVPTKKFKLNLFAVMIAVMNILTMGLSQTLQEGRLDPTVIKLSVSRCEAQYERLFRGELVKLCVNNSTRVKRVVPVVGVIAVGAIASAGVGLGGYALYKTVELKENQEEIMRTLDDLEDKVAITSSEVIFLIEEVKKMGKFD